MKLATTDAFKQLHKSNKNLHVLTNDELKQVQQIELDMLKDILNVCNTFDINYHLTGGTALGAVRHAGFIPWDDDIDIDMERKDISRFLNEFSQMYGDKYWVHTPYSKAAHCVQCIHVRRKNTFFQGCSDPTPEQSGICIDILPIENTYNNKLLRYIHGYFSLALGLIVSCRRFYMNQEYLLSLAESDNEIYSIFKNKIRIGKLVSFFSLEKWTGWYDKWNSRCHNNNSKYVTVATGKNHFFKETYLRKDFCDFVCIQFEGLTAKVPKEIDSYLRHMYGDYMKIPQKGEQEQHVLVKFGVNIDDKRGEV